MACKSGINPGEILSNELYGTLVQATGATKPLPPSKIINAIKAAEAFYESSLQIFLGPTQFIAEPDTRGITLTDDQHEGPALDYTHDFFTEDRWGYVDLDYRPVQSIQKAFISYPATTVIETFNIPIPWLRLDKTRGRFHIVPTGQTPVLLKFGSFLLSLTNGTRLPQSVYVDYTAGFKTGELKARHPQLVEGIKMKTALLLGPILANIRSGGLNSQSLSMDGLSRSQSYGSGKWGPYSGAIEQWIEQEKSIREDWKENEGGIELAVMGA